MTQTTGKAQIDGIELDEIIDLHESYGRFILAGVHDRGVATIGSILEELETGGVSDERIAEILGGVAVMHFSKNQAQILKKRLEEGFAV